MIIANTDKTYCTSEECKNKCNRHISNYTFEDNKNYSFMGQCLEMNVRNEESKL